MNRIIAFYSLYLCNFELCAHNTLRTEKLLHNKINASKIKENIKSNPVVEKITKTWHHRRIESIERYEWNV